MFGGGIHTHPHFRGPLLASMHLFAGVVRDSFDLGPSLETRGVFVRRHVVCVQDRGGVSIEVDAFCAESPSRRACGKGELTVDCQARVC